MSVQPPATAERILARSLGESDEARTILGDLNEDYSSVVLARGVGRARIWYWRESLALSAGALVSRALGRPPGGRNSQGGGDVSSPFSVVGFFQDTQYAVRAIRRDRGFFVFATLIIGLGVGASTAVFSVVSPLLLQPLPFQEPEQLVPH